MVWCQPDDQTFFHCIHSAKRPLFYSSFSSESSWWKISSAQTAAMTFAFFSVLIQQHLTCFRQFRGLSRLQRGPGPLRHRQDGRHQEEVREPRPHLHQPAQAGCHIDPSFLFYYIEVISFYLAKISPSLISFELYGIFIPTLNVIGIIL